MNASTIESPDAVPVQTSVAAKMLNLLVCPTLVFDEVLAGPPKTDIPPGRQAAMLAVASHCTVHNALRQYPDVGIELS